jgi:type II secretory pathway component PulF
LIFYRGFALSFYCANQLLQAGLQLSDTLKLVAETSRLHTVKNDFMNAHRILKEGGKCFTGFTQLENVERELLSSVMQQENLAHFMETIHKRYLGKYMDTMRLVSPAITGVVIGSSVFVILLVVLSLFIPYTDIAQSLSKRL